MYDTKMEEAGGDLETALEEGRKTIKSYKKVETGGNRAGKRWRVCRAVGQWDTLF